MSGKPAGPGASVSLDELSTDPHPALRRLRAEEPVSWVPSLDAWLVTGHELCVEVMLDASTYTVDDPRFSTAQVIGPSMLSLDGLEHRRHRDPFSGPFRAARVRELQRFTEEAASELVRGLAATGTGDLRSGVAAPLAVAVMSRVLDLDDVAVSDVLDWYRDIVAAVHAVTSGEDVPESGLRAFQDLKTAVAGSLDTSDLLGPVNDAGTLDVDEVVSNVAVLLFGGIVTSESSSAIAFRYLLDDPALFDDLRDNPALVRSFVEETFRLEPSAAAVDRYATRGVRLGDADIEKGDLVRVSLSGANRDPNVFADPDRLVMNRANLGSSLTFARGPHACLGIHLARIEAVAAVEALLGHVRPEPENDSGGIAGLVFRVPESVTVRWPGISNFSN